MPFATQNARFGRPAKALLTLVFTLSALVPVRALPPPKLDLTLPYLMLATQKTSTMTKELNQAAKAGYRVITGSPTSGSEMVLILEKRDPSMGLYEHQILATTRTNTMQKELDEASAKGFRLLPSTMISKSQTFGGDEIVVVLEKTPGSSETFKYRLLATSKTSTLQKEMTQGIQDGYEVVGMVSRGEHIVILELGSR